MFRIKLLVSSVLVALLASCGDHFLDQEPNGLSSFWNTEEDAELGINAAYAPLYEEEGFGEGQFWYQCAGDDMTVNNSGETNMVNLANFTATSNTFWASQDRWSILYRVIRRANDVLANVPDIDMDESLQSRILGEANFLLGFAYFELAQRYGGLPFYDIDHPEETNQSRATKEETFQNIEQYFLNATELLTEWEYEDALYGRPTLGAAWGYLAKVYIQWSKWEEAKDAAAKVIESGAYSLVDDYAALFSLETEKNSEVLFAVVNLPTRHQGTITSIVALSQTLTSGSGWNYFAPTRSLVDAFEAGDQRKAVTVAGPGDVLTLLGEEVEITADNISDMSTGYMCAKFVQPYSSLETYQWEAGLDNVLLRLADVYLIYAEAIMRINGSGPSSGERNTPVAAAAEYFNKVRVRAFGNDASKAIEAPSFNDLMKERRCELAYEGCRHIDLVRWNLAEETYAAATTETDPRGPRVFDPVKNAAFLLPQEEIDNSNGVLLNNPLSGYSDFE